MKNLFKRIKNLFAGLVAISNTERLAIWIEYTEQRQKQHNDRIVELEKKAVNNRENNVTLAGDVGATKGEITGLKKQVAANTKLLDMMKKRDVIQTQNDLEFTKEFEVLKTQIKANENIIAKHNEEINTLEHEVKTTKGIVYPEKEARLSADSKIESLKQDLAKLRDGKVNENTQVVKELRKDIKHLTKAYYEAYKESTRRFYWLEDEVYSTDKKPNPEKLTLQLREKADNRFMLNAKEQIQLEIIRLLADQKLPMQKTELNRMVFQAVKGKFITKASVRLFIDELIEEGWLTETQEANIKWINVRG